MRRVLRLAVAGVVLAFPWPGHGTSGGASLKRHTLTVAVEGVANSRGVVGVLVFNSADGWPERFVAALGAKAVPAQEGLTEIVISDLEEGEYAVVVLHDENENKKLDRNWLRLPTEQWGMSNNPKPFLSAPSFSDASFHLEGDKWIHVRLK